MLEPRLLLDQAFGNWYLGANLISAYAVSGNERVGLDYQVALSYSFISGTRDSAAFHPDQPWVLSPSVEFVGDSTFHSEEGGRTEVSVLPGVTLWHTLSGWQVHMGLLVPLRAPREGDVVGLLQFANHLNWASLMGFGKARFTEGSQGSPSLF